MLKKYAQLILLLLVLFACTHTAVAQNSRVVNSSFNTWWSNINKYKLNKKWYLSSELHIRRTNGLKSWQQFLFRPAANFALNESVHFTVGYTYILSYPYGKQSIGIMTPEHNVWEQVTLKHKVGKVSFSHRYRFEQRFIGNRVVDEDSGQQSIDGFKFGERFRYRLTLTVPLIASKKLSFKFFDEIWINQDNFLPTGLNQNWAYLGLSYKITSRLSLGVGFMDQLIKKGDGVHFENNPTTQFTVGYVFGKKSE